LIELHNNQPTDSGIKIISGFANSKELLEIVANNLSYVLLNELVKPVIENYPEQTYSWIN
jgi:hypothetical protein